MKLQPHQEILGVLTDVRHKKDRTELIISIQKRIELPSDVISKEELQNFLGERIGVFNCDDSYKIRLIKRW